MANKTVEIRIRDDQYEFLHKLALDRAIQCGGQVSVSALIRGIIDLYVEGGLTTKGAK
jgi:hypothetical protein